jgi:succinoglycan biosynthesis transport protein ExoP
MNDNQPTVQSGQSTGEALKIREYWHVILERRWLIIATFSVFVAMGAIYAFRATPIFEAVARLQIDPETGGILSMKDAISWGNKDQDYLQTQYRNLQARSLIESVKQKLKLDEDDRYKSAPDTAAAIVKDLDVVPIRLTRLVEIRVRHPNPKTAESIANTLVDNFLQQNQDRKTGKAMAGYRLLKQEAQSQEAELTQAIESLTKYRSQKGMVSLQDDMNVVALELKQAKLDLNAQISRSSDVKNTEEQANKWIKEGREVVDIPLVAQDRLVTELKAKIAAAESKLAGLRTRYRDKHPLVKEQLDALQADRDKLKSEAQRAFEAIVNAARIEEDKLREAEKKFVDSEKAVFTMNDEKTKYEVLQRQKERAETMYQLVLQKTKEYDLSSKDQLQNMVIIDRATTPLKAVKPNKPFILAGSVFGGLAFALGLAFFVNFLDDSVKSQDDVENYLHLPFLGYIPNIKTTSVVERDLQAHIQPTSSAAEGFRTLRAAVSLAKNADKLRNIAVTSTIPSEGKSLVASNYAIVTAQTGLKTLLVDADLRRPSVHKAFQLQSPIGLSAFLSGRVHSIDEIVHKSDVPNLDVICCGATPSNPSELISSKLMLQFLEEVSQRYDRVILDCPPVSAVADPLVVGSMCDGLVFVTKFNKIRREHALRSVQRIQDAGIFVVGVVLNDIDFEGKDSYYYSYHYYQNRYYSSHYKSRTATGTGGGSGKKEGGKEKEKEAAKV